MATLMEMLSMKNLIGIMEHNNQRSARVPRRRRKPSSRLVNSNNNFGLWKSSLLYLSLVFIVFLANQSPHTEALPWSSNTADQISKPSFLSRLNTKVTFEWNGIIITNGGCTTDSDSDSDDDSKFVQYDQKVNRQGHQNTINDSSSSTGGIKDRLLAATRNNTLATALAEQLDSIPSVKEIVRRILYEENEEDSDATDSENDSTAEEEEEEDEGEHGSVYDRLVQSTRNSSLVNSVTKRMPSLPSSVRAIMNRKSLSARSWLASTTGNNTLANALASVPSIKDFLQRNVDNSTGSFDWIGAVSTTTTSRDDCELLRRQNYWPKAGGAAAAAVWRGGGETATTVPRTDNDGWVPSSSSPVIITGLDRFAQWFCLNMAKIVAVQSLATWLKSRERNWIQQLADKLLSEESATAVKTIRNMLDNMEDHGIVDISSRYSAQDIVVSFYALYRLQRAALRYESIQEKKEPDRHPPDLLHLLEDLSHYAVYATAAYGWKMDLAFQGRLHLGDEHALLRKTGIQKDDIIKLSSKSKAHLPVYFLVRDHRHKSLVLCIRGTWSANDILTDLCCTAEEYEGPTSSSTSSSFSSSWTRAKKEGQRFCAHKGMLEAAMAVAIDMEDIIEEELEANPDYSLVLVGHSMGAGCCSLLATFWEHKFNNMKAYLFGGPCVAPLDSRPTNNTAIINVISEGDPFRCLSLGHIADVSAAVARLCEDPNLRRMVLTRTEGHIHKMGGEDLEFCWDTMEDLRNEVMTHSDKMFPPGRLFHVTKQRDSLSFAAKTSSFEYDSDTEDEPGFDSPSSISDVVIHEVGPEYFRELVIGPRMFDISRHLPSLYEDTLRSLIEHETTVGRETRGTDTYY